jgi:NRAMP (natural resistance-associated macrophage protein)-like metal ion transporter
VSNKGGSNVVLGVVTSIGGFVEAGSISTSAQAGAEFRWALLWSIVVATGCVAVLAEMSGRLAAVSKHTLASAVRERFGLRLQVVPIAGELVLDLVLLAAELGGVAIALQLVTGISPRLTVLPIAIVAWLVLWLGKFGAVENGVGILGLVTLVFVVGAWKLHPDLGEVLSGLVPRVPDHDVARYGSLAVSILGATISPYLLNFYSSGAVEESWDEKTVKQNKVIASLGMGFGSIVSIGVFVCAAVVLAGVKIDDYQTASKMLERPFGSWGVPLFAASLAIGCFGAALEVSLNLAYLFAQAFGWNGSKEVKPRAAARFTAVYSVALLVATIPILLGADALKLTMIAMMVTVLILPAVVFPFLVLMNDPQYVGTHVNHVLGNVVVVAVLGLGFLLALVVIPLQILGGS